MKIRLVEGRGKAGLVVRPSPAVAGFSGAAGEVRILLAERPALLLVGLGDASPAALEQAGALAAARILAGEAGAGKAGAGRHVVLDLRQLAAEDAARFALALCLRAWPQRSYRTVPDPETVALARVDLWSDAPDRLERAWRAAKAVLRGVLWARRAVTEPANILTPSEFCTRLARLERHGLELQVLTRKHLRRAGLGGLLAVGAASEHAPRLAVLRWPGTLPGAPVAFIGKGITFDTGGISIKPADKMWEMRADMAGAAACVGAMIALARRRSPAPAVAVLPLAENTTGGGGWRPSDVLTLVDGSSVEIVDTDAEGRIVLADALAWCRATFQPRAMIDLATLTGSIIVALGHQMAGLFDNDASLAASVAAAGSQVGEAAWRMPIGERHREDLTSDIADLKQCATGRLQPDACHAAAFLREFVGETPWVHLDIAGVESHEAADDRAPAGASGFGVRLLDALVALRFEEDAG